MKLRELKKELEDANSKLFDECGLFFAFSEKQFYEGMAKNPLAPGDKYKPIFGGGYVPKTNYKKLMDGLEANVAAYKAKVKSHNLRYREIVYELSNYECFYTGNWRDVLGLFPEVQPSVIYRIYRRELKNQE